MNTSDKKETKKKILIIEDNELNRELLKEILFDRYDIIEAVNGIEGLDVLKNNHSDISLILLDIQMPIMNGYEFLEVYSQNSQYKIIPVIVVTGSLIDEEERCLSLGASDFITKPYIPSIVLSRVDALIRLKDSIQIINDIKLDSLTKIFTRNFFIHCADEELKNADSTYQMLLINISDFLYMNDIYGEMYCDEFLYKIANILSILSNGRYLYGRLNADRFVIMWKKDSLDVHDFIKEFESKVDEEINVNVNFKYAFYETITNFDKINSVINRLNTVIKDIKNQFNVNFIKYDTASLETREYRYFVINNMKKALEEKQFKVFYQPKHSAQDNKLCGAEALIRWDSPEKGMIPPFRFIDIFEENGFIYNLDLFVLECVCKDIRTWLDLGIDVKPVSVNISRRDLIELENASILEDVLNKYCISKNYIHLEITETLCDQGDVFLKKVQKLKESGFKIEIDDFGSGYSSLGIITDIPMDFLKLDMKFARSLEKQKEVVKMIISLAHSLGAQTIAEGVETLDQLEVLKNMGCDYIQGYYFSKPLCYNEFFEKISK